MPSKAFLTLRRVLLAALLYLASLIFIFAIWNIGEAHWDQEPAPGATVFLLFNACFIFVSLAIACIDSLNWNSFISEVRVECAWAGVVCVLQLAAAIAESTTGPPIQCQPSTTWSLCASSQSLTQVAWLSNLISFLYALQLSLSVLGHHHVDPPVWKTKISAVPWFVDQPKLDITGHEPADIEAQRFSRTPVSTPSGLDLSVRSGTPFGSRKGPTLTPPPGLGFQSVEERKSAYGRPLWAKARQIRPGVDEPFPSVQTRIPMGRLSWDPNPGTNSNPGNGLPTIAIHLSPHDADVPQDADAHSVAGVGLDRDALLYLEGGNEPLRLSAVSEWSQESGMTVPVTFHSARQSPI